MYFNDPYDITNENDFDHDVNSDDEYNTLDKGYNKIKQKVNGRYKYIEYYKTPNRPGTMIRDAITGYNTNSLVGSLKEDLYYKVNVAVGDTDKTNPSVLFFENPEQFERHFYCSVSNSTKEKWNSKYKTTVEKLHKTQKI